MGHHVIFVYGTLKKYHHNNFLLESSECLGPGKTVEKYALYEAGIPYVIKDERISYIHGELYCVSSETLERLDRLEGHPDWYQRQQVEILSEDSEVIVAWLYFYPRKTGNLIITGCYALR